MQAGAEIEPDMIHEAAPELAEWLEVQAASEPPQYAELEHAAHAAYLAALPGDRIEVGDGFAVRTGAESNSENGVVAECRRRGGGRRVDGGRAGRSGSSPRTATSTTGSSPPAAARSGPPW